MIIIFSIISPIGLGIGWALSSTSDLVDAIFNSISAGFYNFIIYVFQGTFLYIALSEIIVEEFSISRDKWLKLTFYLLGIFLLVGVWFIE